LFWLEIDIVIAFRHEVYSFTRSTIFPWNSLPNGSVVWKCNPVLPVSAPYAA